MRTASPLNALLLLAAMSLPAAVNAAPRMHPDPKPEADDTVAYRAVTLLKAHLDHLRDLYKFTAPFVNAYAADGQVHCDVCPVKGPVDPREYAFKVTGLFPGGFQFDQMIDTDAAEAFKQDKGIYTVTVPFYKQVPRVNSKGALVPDKNERVDLIAHFRIDYTKVGKGKWWEIQEIVLDKPPALNMLMLEVSGIKAVGRPKSEALSDLDPTFRGSGLTAGIGYYFYPGAGVNHRNIWLRAGLRGGIRRTGLNSDGHTFETDPLALKPTRSLLPDSLAVQHRLRLQQEVKDVKETVNSGVIEVPLGVSKRWHVTDYVDFGLELELGAGVEFARKVTTTNDLTQYGWQTLYWGDEEIDPVTEDGGGRMRYDQPYQVVTDSDGRVHTFGAVDNEKLHEQIESKARPYLFWGLNPSLFLRGFNDEIKYQVGFRFAMISGNRAKDDAPVDGFYFRSDVGEPRPALTTMVDSALRTYIGFNVGMKF